MEKFTVTAVKAGFHPGATLALTPEQLAPRAHALSPLRAADLAALGEKPGEIGRLVACRVERSIEFKRGERVAVLGAVDKQLRRDMASDEPAPAARPKKRAALAGAGGDAAGGDGASGAVGGADGDGAGGGADGSPAT